MPVDAQVARRGLEPNSDIQTFEIHITRGVREKYDEAFAVMMRAAALPGGRDEVGYCLCM